MPSPFPAQEYSELQGQHLFIPCSFPSDESQLAEFSAYRESITLEKRGDFIGSESHCEFIIAGKEENVIN